MFVNQISDRVSVKINKSLTKMELGGQTGETQHRPTSITERTVNYRPQERKHQLQAPTGKTVHRISYKKLTTPGTQPMRNHHHPELSLFSNEFSLKTIFLNFLIFLYKIMFLSFVC